MNRKIYEKRVLRDMEDRVRMLECVSRDSKEKNIELMDQFLKMKARMIPYTLEV